MIRARYVHTNVIARDWDKLARFYEEVFGCVRVPPERDLSGPWLERGTGIPGARIRGAHLRLPGVGDDGPTLEIFSYDEVAEQSHPVANRAGYGHIAFAVEDVAAAVAEVVTHGGKAGEIARERTPAGHIEFAYVRDPEENLIELQRWH
jgi:catechol 2,3-dioxygenase-like lactoylglutathione lyase family enzyme